MLVLKLGIFILKKCRKKNVEGLSFGIVYTLGKCAMVIGDMSLMPHACSKR